MKPIELPQLRAAGDVVAVTLERAEIGGMPVWVITMREAVQAAPRRRWYPAPEPALAYAAEQAERHGLPLFDLRDPADA